MITVTKHSGPAVVSGVGAGQTANVRVRLPPALKKTAGRVLYERDETWQGYLLACIEALAQEGED